MLNQGIWGREDGRKSTSLHLSLWTGLEVMQDRPDQIDGKFPGSPLDSSLFQHPSSYSNAKEIIRSNSTERQTACRQVKSPSRPRRGISFLMDVSWVANHFMYPPKWEINHHWFILPGPKRVWINLDTILILQKCPAEGGSSTGRRITKVSRKLDLGILHCPLKVSPEDVQLFLGSWV